MNITEIGEDLEQQFGKPRNVTAENARFMFSLIQEEFDGTKVNEDVEKPSLDAFGTTILAIMSYQTTPWEELAKKPSIRKALKYIAIRGSNHYDEMEALRNAIGYMVTADGKVQFYNRKLRRKNFLSIIVAYCRSIFHF